MNVKINAIGFTASEPLKNYINGKLGKMDRYNDRILSIEVFLKLMKDDNLEDKFIDVKIDVKGGPIYAEKNGTTFEEAIDIIADVVKRKLIKLKEISTDKNKGK